MDDIWKDIPNFPDYQVSNNGTVRSFKGKNPRVLSRTFNKYWRVSLSKEGTVYKKAIHQLVACAFIGPSLNLLVRHLDGDVNNNCLSNLSYGTQVDNIADAIAHGTQVRGVKVHNAKLTDTNVIELRKLRDEGMTLSELSTRFNVTAMSVHNVISGKTWCHIK
tara:strand:- start:561 stop:1049 length:489 start_codon:yes stop_codon:yes gene_type:complete